jgi:hypothetical protein
MNSVFEEPKQLSNLTMVDPICCSAGHRLLIADRTNHIFKFNLREGSKEVSMELDDLEQDYSELDGNHNNHQ